MIILRYATLSRQDEQHKPTLIGVDHRLMHIFANIDDCGHFYWTHHHNQRLYCGPNQTATCLHYSLFHISGIELTISRSLPIEPWSWGSGGSSTKHVLTIHLLLTGYYIYYLTVILFVQRKYSSIVYPRIWVTFGCWCRKNYNMPKRDLLRVNLPLLQTMPQSNYSRL